MLTLPDALSDRFETSISFPHDPFRVWCCSFRVGLAPSRDPEVAERAPGVFYKLCSHLDLRMCDTYCSSYRRFIDRFTLLD